MEATLTPKSRKLLVGNRFPALSQLWQLFQRHRGGVLLTYLLLNAENAVRVAHPLALGWAITGLLAKEFHALGLFVLTHTVLVLLGLGRRQYDTRVFSRMHSDFAERTISLQREQPEGTSQIAAQSVLLREVVAFFERDLQFVFSVGYAFAGALVMLIYFDAILGGLAAAVLTPFIVLNYFHGRRMNLLNRDLHDQFEQEADVVMRGGFAEIHQHFQRMNRIRVRLSDQESWQYGCLEVINLAFIAACLWRACSILNEPGQIAAVFRYVMMLIGAFDTLPAIISQVAKLCDICRRLPACRA